VSLILPAALALACMAAVGMAAPEVEPVTIDYFYEPGCPDCVRVRDLIMPELVERYDGFYRLNKHDLGVMSNVAMLVAYQEALNITTNEPVSMIVDYRHVLNGFKAIQRGLFERIDEGVALRMEPGWVDPSPIEAPRSLAGGAALAGERMAGFTLAAVAAAGFIDGINPCAIATLVFFASLLAVSRMPGRGLLLLGVPFCAASFATYTAIGLGLLRVLHLVSGFENARKGIEIVMLAALGLLAALSFRDAWRYRISGNADDVALQLPRSIKMRIHSILRKGTRSRNLVLGGLVAGSVVTALESVCTGQVYVPTLVLVIKAGGSVSGAWGYLLLYNAMFVLPLAVVLVLVRLGLGTPRLLAWSRRNVVISKVLLGTLFLGLAALLLAL